MERRLKSGNVPRHLGLPLSNPTQSTDGVAVQIHPIIPILGASLIMARSKNLLPDKDISLAFSPTSPAPQKMLPPSYPIPSTLTRFVSGFLQPFLETSLRALSSA